MSKVRIYEDEFKVNFGAFGDQLVTAYIEVLKSGYRKIIDLQIKGSSWIADVKPETLAIWEASYNHTEPADELTVWKSSSEYEKKMGAS